MATRLQRPKFVFAEDGTIDAITFPVTEVAIAIGARNDKAGCAGWWAIKQAAGICGATGDPVGWGDIKNLRVNHDRVHFRYGGVSYDFPTKGKLQDFIDEFDSGKSFEQIEPRNITLRNPVKKLHKVKRGTHSMGRGLTGEKNFRPRVPPEITRPRLP